MKLIKYTSFNFSDNLNNFFNIKYDDTPHIIYYLLNNFVDPRFSRLSRVFRILKDETRYLNYNVDVFCHHYRIW